MPRMMVKDLAYSLRCFQLSKNEQRVGRVSLKCFTDVARWLQRKRWIVSDESGYRRDVLQSNSLVISVATWRYLVQYLNLFVGVRLHGYALYNL